MLKGLKLIAESSPFERLFHRRDWIMESRSPSSRANAKPAPAKRAEKARRLATSKAAKARAIRAPAASNEPTRPVKLLSGGNPQIPKGLGDAPVQAYIAAMPGWKSQVGQRLDELIVKSAPNVQKAVKWNSPFYGSPDGSWFLSFHTFARYVKVAFFRGTSLWPVPKGPSKQDETRYLDIYEGDEIDEAQFKSWVKQAAALPGWVL
jgi:hypothetical protein